MLVSIGSADVEGDGCTEYADADYFRILDGRLRTPQKVGIISGLGTCSFELRARNPAGQRVGNARRIPYHGLFPRMIRVGENGTCGLRGGPPRT